MADRDAARLDDKSLHLFLEAFSQHVVQEHRVDATDHEIRIRVRVVVVRHRHDAVLARRLRAAGAEVERGTLPDLTAGLRQAGLPDPLIALIATGEQSGMLDRTLDQAAVAARASFQTRAEWATRFLTGAIYAGITVFVAWQIISMYTGVLNAGMEAANES